MSRPPDGGLREADGWRVETLAMWELRHFCRLWHYSQGASHTATYRHGLIAPDWTHQGAALWLPPTQQAAASIDSERWRGVLALSRLVVAPEVPTNGASFLLGHSMRLIDRERWPILVTYADTRLGHTGAIYRATNWTEIGPVPAGDVWLHRETGAQRGRKRGASRTYTRADMDRLGYDPAPSAPKIKFVHIVGR